jgi:AcrR family transcriptional regulator
VTGSAGGAIAAIFARTGLPRWDNDRYHERVTVSAAAPVSSRERLLAAAVEVFVEQGYEGARVQDIARAAGLTTGAIYANFRGKAELLFDAIGVRADAEMDEMLTEARRRDVRQLLELLGDRLVRPRDDAPLLIDAISAARRDDELAGALRDRLDTRERVIAELVERAKRDGSIDPALDTDAFARFSLTLAMGALVMRTLQAPPPDGDAWHQLISRLLDAVSREQK